MTEPAFPALAQCVDFYAGLITNNQPDAKATVEQARKDLDHARELLAAAIKERDDMHILNRETSPLLKAIAACTPK